MNHRHGCGPRGRIEIDLPEALISMGRGRGGWGEASFRLSRYFSVSPGFTTDDPVDSDLPSGGRTRTRAFYEARGFTLDTGDDASEPWRTITAVRYRRPLP